LAWFYTLAAEAAGFGDAPDHLKKGLPQGDVPLVLLGRVAVSLEGQSQELETFSATRSYALLRLLRSSVPADS